MNPRLDRLHAYPFERLAQLKADLAPPPGYAPILLSLGEPQHAFPPFVAEVLCAHLDGLSRYPLTKGQAELREAIAGWLMRRYGLPAGSIDPERQVLPVHGTREALFAIAQAVVDASRAPLVLLPNPFYQIYEGAALLAGAECVYLPTTEASGYQPDYAAVAPSTWERCQLLYVCSPGNPTGAILEEKTLTELIERAERYDFVIAADECYSEIYRDEQNPPAGLLQAALRSGRSDFRRCLVFNSLSKRSNLPGLRSGFVAGDAALIERFLLYRTYHGCAMPLPVQAVSTRAWQDEAHVQTNRTVYREKFDTVSAVLGGVLELGHPPGGFFLWPRTPYDELRFTRELYARYNVTVLPGRFLSRLSAGLDPGVQRVRIALVAPLAECVEAAQRIREFVESQPSAEGMAI